jgi:hypothetical protein
MSKKQRFAIPTKPVTEEPVVGEKEIGRVHVTKPVDPPPAEEVEPVAVKGAEPAPVREKVRYCRLLPNTSFVLWFPHDEYCAKAGKCFCTWVGVKRVEATLHVIAGIPQIIPAVWAQHPLLLEQQRKGKVTVIRL